MRISDWSSDVCSSDLLVDVPGVVHQLGNSLFPVANGVQNALGGDGHAEHRNVPGPPAHANANATAGTQRSEEHTSELQSLMRISYAVFCLKKKKHRNNNISTHTKAKTK